MNKKNLNNDASLRLACISQSGLAWAIEARSGNNNYCEWPDIHFIGQDLEEVFDHNPKLKRLKF